MNARTKRGLTLGALFLASLLTLTACDDAPPQPGWGAGPAGAAFMKMLNQMKRDKAAWDDEGKRMPLYQQRGRGTDRFDMLTAQIDDWYGTPEAKFAHAIKIPNPVPEDSGYRPGMTQQEYFEHLCKTEAGEFIFKTVDNVEGIFQMRPRKIYSGGEWQHLYAVEDPYGYWPGEAEDVGFTFVRPILYSFFEIPVLGRRIYGVAMRSQRDESLFATAPADARIARYSGYDGINSRLMKLNFDQQRKARYGFTWRGIRRPHDRELGIAGGELIVLDLETQEVLGVRRGYVVWNGGWTGRVCPRYGYSGGQDKTTYFTTWFLAKVARPVGWEKFFAEEERHRRLR